MEITVGPVDIVVNNAGAEIGASCTAYSPDEVSELITLDLVAPLLLIKAVLPGMVARRHGQVVNICSLASKGPLPYGVPYSAAKSGLAMATQSLRLEYARSGVGFSAVLPGFVTQAGIFARHQRSAQPSHR